MSGRGETGQPQLKFWAGFVCHLGKSEVEKMLTFCLHGVFGCIIIIVNFLFLSILYRGVVISESSLLCFILL